MTLSAFGPVPSRRLGFSIGINHIPPKHCPYACVYCQVGATNHMQIKPGSFYTVDAVYQVVQQAVQLAQKQHQSIDFLTFVPDGEPTLDQNLGAEIDALRDLGYPIAVITNGALINHPDVRQALGKADWVSLKIDSVIEPIWRSINRPHRALRLDEIMSGMLTFASEFGGEFVTETMLISGLNDDLASINRLADFLYALQPFKSYLSTPIRPPAESWVCPLEVEKFTQIRQIISKSVPVTPPLIDIEANKFVSTGNLVQDILNITAVHPLREEALRQMLAQAGADWAVIEDLVTAGEIARVQYRGTNFYLRCFSKPPQQLIK